MSLLSAISLDVYYGHLHAVRTLSFQVERGQIVALLGPNGAGKTSVIRAVCGLIPVPGDPLAFGGRSLRRVSANHRVSLGMATVPEGRELFPSLTVEENLLMGAYRRRDRKAVRQDLAWVLELFPALAGRRKATAATLSGGQGQMLAIGRALMAQPTLLLLDEPSLGLAPNLVNEVFHLLPRLQVERSLSILLVEQNANMAFAVASYGYVLEAGEMALEGPADALKHDPRVRALYLGGQARHVRRDV
jgi:branched-chain amino acid transport system ATP-binding protein